MEDLIYVKKVFMDRTLVVVTCDKDRWSFEMLCRSIHKFLKPSPILIIVNENDPESWQTWYKEIMYLLDGHRVKVKNKYDFWDEEIADHLHPLRRSGWIDQQVLKLYAGKFVDSNEYVVLDSKNFFIKPTSLRDILQIKSEYITSWAPKNLKNTVDLYCSMLNLRFTHKILPLTQNTTPYVIYKDYALALIKHFGDIENFYKVFTESAIPKEFTAAEFFLYEIFTFKNRRNNKGQCQSNNIGFWHFHIEDLDYKIDDFVNLFEKHRKNPEIFTSGLHKSLRQYITLEEINLFFLQIELDDLLPQHTPSVWKT